MTLRLNGSSSGYTELDAPAVAGSNTLVLPGGNGAAGQVLSTNGSGALSWVDRMTAAGPAFSATANAGATITSSTFTKVAFQVEEFDTASCYDNTTNYRFTPNVAGYYQITARTQFTSNAGTSETMLVIYKNGAEARRGNAGSIGISVSAIVYLNGSSDYVEIYVLQATGGSVGITGASNYAYFQAALIRPA